ncbi:MAG: HAD family hydrolase [Anaerolineae bacterium]|nr:HAD family hydrolase [Anaerolineae bacterium]
MLQAILFDLDDTLLRNKMDSFLPHYFKLLGEYAAALMDKERFMQEMLMGTRAMINNNDPTLTNREVFWRVFQQRTGLDPAIVEPYFTQFYQEQFPSLQEITEPVPGAVDLVEWAFAKGFQVVVATNPLFPRIAIEERLRWANLPVSHYPFALVTCYEEMHAAKPNQAYYHEILARIHCRPDQALMVGDDQQNDILPPTALGMASFWLHDGPDSEYDSPTRGHGSLADLAICLQAGWLQVD